MMNLKTKDQLISAIKEQLETLGLGRVSTSSKDHPYVAKKYLYAVRMEQNRMSRVSRLLEELGDYLRTWGERRFVIMEVESGLLDGFYTANNEWWMEEIRRQWEDRFPGSTYVVIEAHTKFDIPGDRVLHIQENTT